MIACHDSMFAMFRGKPSIRQTFSEHSLMASRKRPTVICKNKPFGAKQGYIDTSASRVRQKSGNSHMSRYYSSVCDDASQLLGLLASLADEIPKETTGAEVMQSEFMR
jgi:hypothetical protein